MSGKAILLAIVAAVMAMLLSSGVAIAQRPPGPAVFFGTVTIGGSPAPDGTVVTAEIDGVEYARTTTSSGRYGDVPGLPPLQIPADDPSTPEKDGGVSGETIVFKVNGVAADQTAVFEQFDIQILDLTAPAGGGGGSGGGGGGGGGAPPTYYTGTNLFGIEGSFRISNIGEILETITGTSVDGKLTVTIPVGTIALDKDGNRLSTLTATVDLSPPPPPEGANIIELAYDFGPDGATFDPPITLEYTYDPAEIPEGVAEEDLVLAYYDEATSEWVELPCIVDTVSHRIIATVSHFTTFAIIAPAPPPAPAAFSLSNLTVHPAQVEPGETVTVAVHVANTGGTQGSYIVVLKINGVKEAEKSVTVAAGSSEIVTFSVTKEDAASYSVTVDGLSSSFTVVAPVVAPLPAAFSVSNLSIQPAEVLTGEVVTIDVALTNTGGTHGTYTVVLKINGVREADRTVTIDAGDTLNIIFPVTKEAAGSYTVTVDGLSGSFTVVAPVTNWPLIGGIIGGVIVVALLVFFLVFRRRAY